MPWERDVVSELVWFPNPRKGTDVVVYERTTSIAILI